MKYSTVRIADKFVNFDILIYKEVKAILVNIGEKGSLAIGTAIEGEGLGSLESRFMSNRTEFEVELVVAGNWRCCAGRLKMVHQVWIVEKGSFDPLESVMRMAEMAGEGESSED